MPYFDALNTQLNLNDTQLTQARNIIRQLHANDPDKFVSEIDYLITKLPDKKLPNGLIQVQESTDENKAIEDEILRKCKLIQFLHSIKNNLGIPIKEYTKFYQLVYYQQEVTIEQFFNNMLFEQIHDIIFTALMELVPGYVLVKDALPKFIINIFRVEEVKKPQLSRFTELQSVAGDIAFSLGEDLVYTNHAMPMTSPTTQKLMKPKASKTLTYDDNNAIEMKELKPGQKNSNGFNTNKSQTQKTYSPKVHKAFIQILFFKHIASDSRVMQSSNNKILLFTQQAIEGICTKISNYVHPQQTSSYEGSRGFEINRFVTKNVYSFWNNINQVRNLHSKKELENRNSAIKSELNAQIRDNRGVSRSGYTEIPDSSVEQQSSLDGHSKVANTM